MSSPYAVPFQPGWGEEPPGSWTWPTGDEPALPEPRPLEAAAPPLDRAAVKAGKTIGVTGPMGAGKTTMLRALAAEYPRTQRIATIETEFELGLHLMRHRHLRVWPVEVREPTADSPDSGVDLIALIAQSLRHNNRKVILGEVRSHEIVPLLDVIATSP